MASTKDKRMTREEIRALSGLTEEVKSYLKSHPLPSLGSTPQEILSKRSISTPSTLRSAIGPAPPSLHESELHIPIPNDHDHDHEPASWLSRTLLCRSATHASPSPGSSPLIVLFHGGGFAMGHPEGMLPYARSLALLFRAVVLCPSYRLAPEHKFPTGVNDAYAVLRYAAAHAADWGADSAAGFIVGGNSAGANFAGVLARRSVQEGLEPPLTGHWMSFPAFGNADAAVDGVGRLVPGVARYAGVWGMSWVQNRDAVLIDSGAAAALFELYGQEYDSPLYNPLTGTPGFDVARLPRALVQVAGADLLRDDGIVYAYVLQDAGVEARLLAYPGVPHTFPAFLPGLEVSGQAMVDVMVGFGWLLGVEVEEDKVREAVQRKS
ncbi:hypothetical protein IQ07DRAFT_583364 [Pyrenochaeta sp. DS3sAY3a]|nr:hypothetical protein IQ07DRAFT_583364 [Pyrenochaeta sp. DS3sAY3a]